VLLVVKHPNVGEDEKYENYTVSQLYITIVAFHAAEISDSFFFMVPFSFNYLGFRILYFFFKGLNRILLGVETG
jgi:hypothetical protein|tara:strand:+ start:378 stop:599 length:222 start_codon:yes stop_codon:yes gene_type:complete